MNIRGNFWPQITSHSIAKRNPSSMFPAVKLSAPQGSSPLPGGQAPVLGCMGAGRMCPASLLTWKTERCLHCIAIALGTKVHLNMDSTSVSIYQQRKDLAFIFCILILFKKGKQPHSANPLSEHCQLKDFNKLIPD